MRDILTILPRIIWGLGSGFIISGGVVAFISIIGIVPMMAYRTRTASYVKLYETAISLGSVIGSVLSIWEPSIPLNAILIIVFSFSFGIFVGLLILALAEVLDVFPIIDRRFKLKKGISLIVVAFALGKLVGSLYYWLYPIFLEIMNQ